MTTSDEPDWLSGLRRQDENALSECFAEFRPRLSQIISFRLNPRLSERLDTEDVLQDAYLAAAQRIQFCDTSTRQSVFIWLRMIVRQTLIDLHRKHFMAAGRDVQREVRADQTPTDTSGSIAGRLVAKVSSPSRSLRREELQSQLLQALNQMEKTDREVLALRHFEELTNGEVAETLKISVKAASIRYIRALKKLKAILTSFSDLRLSP